MPEAFAGAARSPDRRERDHAVIWLTQRREAREPARCRGPDQGIAIAALVKIGPPAVEPLIAALDDPEYSNGALDYVRCLGEIGDQRAVVPLTAALRAKTPRGLKPTDGWVKMYHEECATALKQIGDA